MPPQRRIGAATGAVSALERAYVHLPIKTPIVYTLIQYRFI
jgi:hypothetical protein